jgi:hypothetical protein
MNKMHDDYRKQAAAAQDQADKARNDGDRASWLRIAQGWLGLLPASKPTSSEKFDEQASQRGTGQPRNESSN